MMLVEVGECTWDMSMASCRVQSLGAGEQMCRRVKVQKGNCAEGYRCRRVKVQECRREKVQRSEGAER